MPDRDQGDSSLENTVTAAGGGHTGAPFKQGSIIGGSYRLVRLIGRGGMGVVYLAEHLTFKRNYALKVLAPEQVTEANWRRFQSEGKAIARLEHRNIVKIYDMAVEGDMPFYVMDLLEGPSLAEYIRARGVLSEKQVLDIFSQICAGLSYSHKNGIIHRDIKPANIILTGMERGDGTPPLVKIVDFGLAKAVGDVARLGQSQTATGEVFGSPLYMSPEQCLGTKVDERSDVYSLGCTLFEALTGSPPFRGETALQTAMMHQQKEPPALAELRPDIKYAPGWEEITGLMLQKKAADRPQTMADVARQFDRLRQGKPVSPLSAFADGPLYKLEKEKLAFGLLGKLAVSLVVLLSVAGIVGAIFYVAQHSRQRRDVATVPLSPEERDLRSKFDNWPTISAGIVTEKNGMKVRSFHFPPIAIGQIDLRPVRDPVPASDYLDVMPEQKIILKINAQYGSGVLKYPAILSKIGFDDVEELHLQAENPLDELNPAIFDAISKWKGLKVIDIDEFTIHRDAFNAMNRISPVPVVRFSRGLMEDGDLAQVKWLHEVGNLDIKGMSEPAKTLAMMRGSTRLLDLRVDRSVLSTESLENIATFPNLNMLILTYCEIDDQRAAVIARCRGVKTLALSGNAITRAGLSAFSAMSGLEHLALDHCDLTEADLAELRKLMPNCQITGP